MRTPEPQDSQRGSPTVGAVDADRLFGRLRQLQTRRPQLISDISRTDLVVDVSFFLEDIAIDATQRLLDGGITAVHRMDTPKTMSLQLPSVVEQRQGEEIVQLLDEFLKARGQSPA